MTPICFIFAIGFFFAAFLFNFNVGWGHKGAKTIRNTFAACGVALLLMPLMEVGATHTGMGGYVLITGGLLLMLIGIFLTMFAMLYRRLSSKNTYRMAINGTKRLVVVAMSLMAIGMIVVLTEGGGK